MQTLDKNKMKEIPPGNTVTQIKDFRDSSSRKPYPVHYSLILPTFIQQSHKSMNQYFSHPGVAAYRAGWFLLDAGSNFYHK